jgi:hypothetical protein
LDFGGRFDGMSFEMRAISSAPLVGSGCDPFLAGFVGNAVGAMKIRIVGHRHTITRAEVVKYLTSLLK